MSLLHKFFNLFIKIKKRTLILFSFLLAFLLAIPKVTYAGIDDYIINALAQIIPKLPAILFKEASRIFAEISSKFFTFVLEELILREDKRWNITTAEMFISGWISVRDLANMLIVLSVIGIAIATILRFREFEAKKLLLPVIILAFLINFSNVFVGATIDASNSVMKLFAKTIAGQNTKMVDTINSLYNKVNEKGNRSWNVTGGLFGQYDLGTFRYKLDTIITNSKANQVGTMFRDAIESAFVIGEIGVIYLLTGLTFLVLAILIIARYAVLAILFILSPLAFAFRVFPLPDTKKLWTMWWEKFIKWCFIGVGGMFFLYLSNKLLVYMTKVRPDGLNAADADFNGDFSIFRVMINLGVVCIFLLAGLKITLKAAPMVTGAVMGIAGTAAGYALGATRVVAPAAGIMAGGVAGALLGGGGRAGHDAAKGVAEGKGFFGKTFGGISGYVSGFVKGAKPGAKIGAAAGGAIGGTAAGAASGLVAGLKRKSIWEAAKGAVLGGAKDAATGAKVGAGVAGGVTGAVGGILEGVQKKGNLGEKVALGIAGAATGAGTGVREGLEESKDFRAAVGKKKDQALEGLGITKIGSAKVAEQARLEAKLKPYEAVAEAEKDNDVIAQRAINSKTSAERAAYVNVLQKRKKLNKIEVKDSAGNVLKAETKAKRQQAINDANAYNIDTSEFPEKDHRFAEFEDVNKKALERIETTDPRAIAAGTAAGAAGTKAYIAAARAEAQKIAVQQQLEENLSSMSREQRRNIDKEHLTPDLITSRTFNAGMVRDFKSADRERIDALQDVAVTNELNKKIKEARKDKNKGEENRLKNVLREIENLPSKPGTGSTPPTPPRGGSSGGKKPYTPKMPPPSPTLPPIPLVP